MTSLFRLGLIGAGRMGRTHLAALETADTVRVAAIADPSPAAMALARPDRAIFPDAPSMLAASGLDGVLIATPTPLHGAAIAAAIAANLPILCEKPCGLTAADAGAHAALARAAGVRLQVAYWRRFVPELQAIKARIDAGQLGALYHIACHQWDGAPPSPEFRASSGGLFVDMGVHEFDQVRWLTGQEFETFHSLRPAAGEGIESVQTLCRLSGGATALIDLGQRFPLGDVCRVEVFGTADAAESRFLWPPDADAAFHDALRRQAAGFAAWVRGAPPQGATAEDAIAALAAAERA